MCETFELNRRHLLCVPIICFFIIPATQYGQRKNQIQPICASSYYLGHISSGTMRHRSRAKTGPLIIDGWRLREARTALRIS